jgi:hypothetical protein
MLSKNSADDTTRCYKDFTNNDFTNIIKQVTSNKLSLLLKIDLLKTQTLQLN